VTYFPIAYIPIPGGGGGLEVSSFQFALSCFIKINNCPLLIQDFYASVAREVLRNLFRADKKDSMSIPIQLIDNCIQINSTLE